MLVYWQNSTICYLSMLISCALYFLLLVCFFPSPASDTYFILPFLQSTESTHSKHPHNTLLNYQTPTFPQSHTTPPNPPWNLPQRRNYPKSKILHIHHRLRPLRNLNIKHTYKQRHRPDSLRFRVESARADFLAAAVGYEGAVYGLGCEFRLVARFFWIWIGGGAGGEF